ncbi:MAG: hypothetical protein ACP5HD_10655 [Thermoproteus sp.]
MIEEVLILVLSVAVAAVLITLASPLVADVASAAYGISEYRSLYALPTVHVFNGQVYLCLNDTRAVSVQGAKAMFGCSVMANGACAQHGTMHGQQGQAHGRGKQAVFYCAAWIGPVKPGDKITYVLRGQRVSRAITIQVNSISLSQK